MGTNDQINWHILVVHMYNLFATQLYSLITNDHRYIELLNYHVTQYNSDDTPHQSLMRKKKKKKKKKKRKKKKEWYGHSTAGVIKKFL